MLYGWKQIAAYFGKAESTLKRYHRKKKAPIEKMQGAHNGEVRGCPKKLTAWFNSLFKST